MSPAANCYHTEIMCNDEKQHPCSVDAQHEQGVYIRSVSDGGEHT